MWGRSMLRRHVLGTVLLVLFVAMTSGTVAAAVASARRADSSIGRFTEQSLDFDATLFSCPPGVDPNGFDSQYAVTTACLNPHHAADLAEELSGMPGVERVSLGGYYVVGVLDDRAPNGWGQVTLLAATLGRDPGLIAGTPKVLAGRLPRVDANDELMVTERAARRSGVHLGDRITIASWPLEDLDAGVNGGMPPDRSTALTMRVVGIGRFAGDLAQGESPDISGNYFGGELNANGRSGDAVRDFANYGVAPLIRLHERAGGLEAFQSALSKRWAGRFFSVEPAATTLGDSRANEQRVDTERQGVLAFAVIVAIATMGFAGLTLFRQLRREQADVRTLRQLGMTKRDVVLASLLRALVLAVPAAVLTVVVGVALSPLGPVGLARRAEPALGVHADVPVLVAGSFAVLVFVLGVAGLPGLLGLRPERDPRPAEGWLNGAATSLGAAARVGLSFARGSWPRIAAGVTAVALTALVAAGITVASLDRVVSSAPRFGAWWDADLGDFADPDTLAAGAEIVAADKDVQALSSYSEQSDVATVNRRPLTVASFTVVKGKPGPVVTRGRAPANKDEIALGARLREDLGVDIGGTVRLSSVEGAGSVVDRKLRVTGEILFNDPVTLSTSLGEGGVVTPALLDELSAGAGQRLLARFTDGADREVVTRRLARRFPGPIRAAIPPDDVRNLESLRWLPWLLALLVGALAAVTLAHALILTVRHRRRDLAVLSVLGLTRWGTRRVTAFSTLLIVGLATLGGVPAGLFVGRLLWEQLRHSTGLASSPVRTWAEPAVVAAGMLVAAQAVTLVATRRLTAARPATILRAE